jgi:hypothetical protein
MNWIGIISIYSEGSILGDVNIDVNSFNPHFLKSRPYFVNKNQGILPL